MDTESEKPTLKTEIILGKDLPEETIQMMEAQRIKEYGSNSKDFRNKERDSTFFFLKEGDEVKAFGMLKPVTIYYEDQTIPVMGIANVIAVEKSKGWGSVIMQQITEYLERNKIPGWGNTYSGNFEFYKKCGYTFIPGLLQRMVYIKDNGEELTTNAQTEEGEDYSMFIYDSQGALKDIVEGDKRVVIKVPFW